MPTPYLIPLSAQAQNLSVSLGGVTYNFSLVWNAPAACWMLDISDQYDNPLVTALPLIAGVDLLQQFQYLGFNGGLICVVNGDPNAVATYANLGTDANLYWLTFP